VRFFRWMMYPGADERAAELRGATDHAMRNMEFRGDAT
jgi:hypothetical protein